MFGIWERSYLLRWETQLLLRDISIKKYIKTPTTTTYSVYSHKWSIGRVESVRRKLLLKCPTLTVLVVASLYGLGQSSPYVITIGLSYAHVIYMEQGVKTHPWICFPLLGSHVILSTLRMSRPGRPKGVLKCPTLVEGWIIVSLYILDNRQS